MIKEILSLPVITQPCFFPEKPDAISDDADALELLIRRIL